MPHTSMNSSLVSEQIVYIISIYSRQYGHLGIFLLNHL